MNHESLRDQLNNIRPMLNKQRSNDNGQLDAVDVNIQDGTAEVRTPMGSSKVELSSQDQRDFIENAKKYQQASIREKRLSGWASFAITLLTVAAAAGAGYASMKNTGGSTGKR